MPEPLRYKINIKGVGPIYINMPLAGALFDTEKIRGQLQSKLIESFRLQPDPFDFVNEYHKDTVSQKRALRHEGGELTTVMASGISYGGKIYMVPSYNRETGEIMNEDQTQEFWSEKIPELERSGRIWPIPDNWGGPLGDHPANVMARENHRALETETYADDVAAFGAPLQ